LAKYDLSGSLKPVITAFLAVAFFSPKPEHTASPGHFFICPSIVLEIIWPRLGKTLDRPKSKIGQLLRRKIRDEEKRHGESSE